MQNATYAGTAVGVEGPTAWTSYKTIQICAGSQGPQPTGCNANAPVEKRSVAYFVSEHGNAVIDGDVIFGSESDI